MTEPYLPFVTNPICIACGDTGRNSRGGDCRPCRDNGRPIIGQVEVVETTPVDADGVVKATILVEKITPAEHITFDLMLPPEPVDPYDAMGGF